MRLCQGVESGRSRHVAASDLEPRVTPAKVAAYAIAACVYVFAIGLAAGGVALAVATRNVVGIWLARRRMSRLLLT